MSYVITNPNAPPDKSRLLALWRRNLPTASEGRLAWLYDGGRATNWFVSTQTGDVVGATGLMRRRMKLGPHLLEAGNAIDFNVDQEHRSVGPALQLQRAVTGSLPSSAMPLVYALPSPEATAVMKRTGYRVLGQLNRWARPLHSEYKLRERIKPRLLAKLAGFCIDAGMWLRSAEFSHHCPASLCSEVLDGFDKRFDHFWKLAARQFPVVGERTASYLDWRFQQCPDLKYRVFCLSDIDRQLVGYVVYFLSEGHAYISDMLFADRPALHLLLGEFLQHLRDIDTQSAQFEYFGAPFVTEALQAFGFSNRGSRRPVLVYLNERAAGPNVADILKSENWFLTKADCDTDV
jgi:hypothetical protein